MPTVRLDDGQWFAVPDDVEDMATWAKWQAIRAFTRCEHDQLYRECAVPDCLHHPERADALEAAIRRDPEVGQ